MYKLFIGLLAISSSAVFAVNNNLFQEFDNQVSIGFGMSQARSSFGTNPRVVDKTAVSQTNIVNLEAERLLNNGVWIDINANMAFGAGPVGASPYVNPSDYNINGKVGYAFTMANQHLQITPYGLVGLTNIISSAIPIVAAPTVANPQIANIFAYTAGIGGRIEYRISRAILVYADQLAAYNWDQSGPTQGNMPQNFVVYTSTLGAKFNIVKNFQIGIKGFYNNYQPQASNFVTAPPITGFLAQPQNAIGGLISVGLTY